MKRILTAVLGGAALLGLLVTGQSLNAQDKGELRSPADFESIADEKERSIALFEEMAKVITHPRCMNCHPVDGGPRQGDQMAAHKPPVIRGEDSFGAPGMRCTTCHSDANVELVGVGGIQSIPGHAPWHLPPKEMGWIGMSVGQICEQLKDPERNGDRTLDELHEHNATDGLVGWGWNPGKGREPVPGTQELFGALTKAWIDLGAECPAG